MISSVLYKLNTVSVNQQCPSTDENFLTIQILITSAVTVCYFLMITPSRSGDAA